MIPAEAIDGQSIVLPGLGSVTPRKVMIASAHFATMTAKLWHAGRNHYVLPAPQVSTLGELRRETLSVIPVFDAFQYVPHSTDFDTPPRPLPMPVDVNGIVVDLINQWTKGRVGAAGKVPPGIMRLQGVEPTVEEFNFLVKQERDHCMALVDEADYIHLHKPQDRKIQDSHRMALMWLGSTRRDWFKVVEPGITKTSIVSGKQIPMEALVDEGVDLIEFYLKYGIQPESVGDTYVANLFRDPKFLANAKKRMEPVEKPGGRG